MSAEKTRVDSVEENGQPMDEVVHESLSKLPPDTTENDANGAAMEISSRVTASFEVSTKKAPEDRVVAANEEPASMDVPIKKDPMEDVDQESLSKHLPNKPDGGVVAANEEEVGQENLKKLAMLPWRPVLKTLH